MTKKIEKLTKEQEALMQIYREEGIKIGLATGPEMDEQLVRELTDAHRELCGVPKAKTFLVFPSPEAAIAEFPDLTPGNALYGQHDIGWLQYYHYIHTVLGIQEAGKLKYLRQLCEHTGWMWMSSTHTVVTRRPQSICLLQKTGGPQVLHNYNGLALRYQDGTGVYSINGTRIPKQYHKLVLAYPEEISVEEVLNIPNTEIRTEFLKKIGIARAFTKLQKKVLDIATLEIGGKYELFTVEMGDVTRTYLHGQCPSSGDPFFNAVSPECTTVEQALNFRNGFKLQLKYQPPLELT